MNRVPAQVTLYRYFNEEGALRTLDSMMLRVALIDKLNDPFDCFPQVYFSDGVRQDDRAGFERKILDHRSSTYGLLCFSRTWREPVLWSHYADHHRGIALVLRMERGKQHFPVKYRPRREKVIIGPPGFIGPPDMNAFNRAHFASLITKSPTWRYEQETRIFVRLDDCELHGGQYFRPLPCLVVAGVILGLRNTTAPRLVFDLLRKGRVPKGKVWRAEMSRSRFSLDRSELIHLAENPI